jgi:hypothetical protein
MPKKIRMDLVPRMRLAGLRMLINRRQAHLGHQPTDAVATNAPAVAPQMSRHLTRAVARTGVQLRAVDDQVRSSPSSDPGFGQKIRLHNKLTDLGMKLRDLGVTVGLNLRPPVVEHLRQLLDPRASTP